MNIYGKKVVLRAIEEEDLPRLHLWANDPETQDMVGHIHFPSSMHFHKQWFNNLLGDRLNQRFAIDAPGVGIIGISSIINIDWKNNRAWHGMMIGDKDSWGKGYATDASMAVMRYAFDEMHLKRLDGSIIEYNKASKYLYCDKLGWKVEGVRRQYYFRKGRYWDQLVTGITEEDYRALEEKMGYWGKE